MAHNESRIIRIAFFVAEFHRFAGSQRYVLQLASNLPPEVQPIGIFPGEGICTEEFRRARIQTFILPAPHELNQFGKILMNISILSKVRLFIRYLISYTAKMTAFLRRTRIDLLHCSSARGVLLTGFAARMMKLPVVWDNQGRLVGKGILRILPQILASRIALIAEDLRRDIHRAFHWKCQTIYKGFEIEYIVSIKEDAKQIKLPEGYNNSGAVISAFSSITPFKGYHHLIEAAYIIKSRCKKLNPVFLIIAGVSDNASDKLYYEYLRKLVDEYELQNVHFAGWQKEPLPYYVLSDIVVLPSVEQEQLVLDDVVIDVEGNEGWGRVISEAMYMSKPVVASNIAGIPEQVLDGKTGILVPPGDPESLADALIRLIESPDMREQMGQAGAARVRQVFSMERMVKDTVALYRNLVK